MFNDLIFMEYKIDDSSYGNGNFGFWFFDQFKLPAYEYTCMQSKDPRAQTNTSGKNSTDHWHQVGNDRIILTAHCQNEIIYLINCYSYVPVTSIDTIYEKILVNPKAMNRSPLPPEVKVQKEFEEQFEIPVILLPQLYGLAMGLESDALGLDLHRIETDNILQFFK